MKIQDEITGLEVEADIDFLWCMHCEKSFRVENRILKTVDGFKFSACPTPGCNGEIVGKDLHPNKWW